MLSAPTGGLSGSSIKRCERYFYFLSQCYPCRNARSVGADIIRPHLKHTSGLPFLDSPLSHLLEEEETFFVLALLFSDADALDVHQLRDFFKERGIVPDAHRAVVRGRGGKPLVHVRVQLHAEVDMRLRVADG